MEQLLTIFEAVYLLIEPFFDPKNSWNGQPQEHLCFRTLRENYPDLSGEQIVVLISEVRRKYTTLRLQRQSLGG